MCRREGTLYLITGTPRLTAIRLPRTPRHLPVLIHKSQRARTCIAAPDSPALPLCRPKLLRPPLLSVLVLVHWPSLSKSAISVDTVHSSSSSKSRCRSCCTALRCNLQATQHVNSLTQTWRAWHIDRHSADAPATLQSCSVRIVGIHPRDPWQS